MFLISASQVAVKATGWQLVLIMIKQANLDVARLIALPDYAFVSGVSGL